MSKEYLCSSCETPVPTHEQYEVEGRLYCPDCCDDHTVVCDTCGERILRGDSVSDNHSYHCRDCFDTYCYSCTECGRTLTDGSVYYSDDEDTPYCSACFEELDLPILDYNEKPAPIFYGTGTRYFGVELEIDVGGKNTQSARKILDTANQGDNCLYIKADSSLNAGMELVTHPMTLEYHHHTFPWQDILQQCMELGYRSHQTDTCGLHVHVNRNSFSADYNIQEEYIARILFFVEAHWPELLRFSRRTQEQINHWAARYGYKDTPMEILSTAKKAYGGRYTCVNIQGTHTIEFRIFRGTLKWNTLIATLQMIDEICNVAFSYNEEELNILSWSSFVSKISSEMKPELITYLKERRLYVNEPVALEEDI